MAMAEKETFSHACLRSEEFGALGSRVDGLTEDVITLNKIVMTGNGEPPLATTVPILARAVKELVPAVQDLRTGLSGFVKYQSEQEGYHRGKEAVRKRSRWIIGILVSIGIALLTTMIVLR